MATLFIADLTLAGAYFAAFLKPLIAAVASAFVGLLPLLSPMLFAALQNFVLAEYTEALAGPANTDLPLVVVGDFRRVTLA